VVYPSDFQGDTLSGPAVLTAGSYVYGYSNMTNSMLSLLETDLLFCGSRLPEEHAIRVRGDYYAICDRRGFEFASTFWLSMVCFAGATAAVLLLYGAVSFVALRRRELL
jgi:hypothetical protein